MSCRLKAQSHGVDGGVAAPMDGRHAAQERTTTPAETPAANQRRTRCGHPLDLSSPAAVERWTQHKVPNTAAVVVIDGLCAF